jgi:hypothetical protein
MTTTFLVRKIFLEPFGAQGRHPKTGLSNIGKTHLCSLKLIGSSDFAQLFFRFGIDGGQQNMDTSDPSATYVSWNPG